MTKQKGLTLKEAKELQIIYGRNEIKDNKKGKLRKKIFHIFSEPIYLLLSCASVIYFLLGEQTEGAIMIAFVLFVIGIDVLQETRAGNTLKKLRELSAPKVKVIREEKEMMVNSVDLVPGDVMLISEGVKIPADGYLISASGLCMDESILTGEAQTVWKKARSENTKNDFEEYYRNDYCYTGSMVTLGNGTVIVDKIGNETEYGKIADNVLKASEEETLLQKQMCKLAKQCTYIAAVLFILVSSITFLNLSHYELAKRLIQSMLAGVVLALSMVPGEFPVIQSVFLTMGALRLAKKKALIKRLPSVETLGAISVFCVDKTGTITQNKMEVKEFWHLDGRKDLLCRAMTLACKSQAYDPMEMAMIDFCDCLDCCEKQITPGILKACSFMNIKPKLVKEYVFTNEWKAMGQVWNLKEEHMIAAKGCPETILSLCELSKEEEIIINSKVSEMSKSGLRVIAVADRTFADIKEIPEKLLDCKLVFRGVVGLYDPPREHMKEHIEAFQAAGIRVIMVTGDHSMTAASVGKMVGIKSEYVMSGKEIESLSELELREKVKDCNIFSRVQPLHKMRIVKALKENGEIVAMTGDGVNDSPALKIADIGIAMGKHGSEVSREAADLVLLDDNFKTVLDSIQDGRRIYQNICKAVGYVFAIHIPIALISLIAPMLGIVPEALLLLPLHIVLLELVMDPTCSVVLERQPAEDNILKKPPRKPKDKLLSKRLLLKSTIQGLLIFISSFSIYYGMLLNSYPIKMARTSGFVVLVLSNIFLVLVNCSEEESFVHTLNKIKKDLGIWIINLLTISGLFIMLYTPISNYLGFTPLPFAMFAFVTGIAAISVLWYEVIKLFHKKIRMHC